MDVMLFYCSVRKTLLVLNARNLLFLNPPPLNRSFNALELGGTARFFKDLIDGLGSTVEALLCCNVATAARSINALLGTASEDDQLDREEEEHKRLHDLFVEMKKHYRSF